jgi:hypothetical protein
VDEPRSLEDLGAPERDLLAYTDVLEQWHARTGGFAKFALDQPAAPAPPAPKPAKAAAKPKEGT